MLKKRLKPPEEEHIPECTEVKLAYDLSAIPLLGGLYAILYIIVIKKLGFKAASQSYWLRKGRRRFWTRSAIPIIIAMVAGWIYWELSQEDQRIRMQRRYSESMPASNTLKAIVASQTTYVTRYNRYAPSLAVLVSSGILQIEELRNCTAPGRTSADINGYSFEMTSGRPWTATTFYVRCKPVDNDYGYFIFSTDTYGRIVTTEMY